MATFRSKRTTVQPAIWVPRCVVFLSADAATPRARLARLPVVVCGILGLVQYERKMKKIAFGFGGTVRAAPSVGRPPRARVRDIVRAHGDGGRRADGALRRSAGFVPAGPEGPKVRGDCVS